VSLRADVLGISQETVGVAVRLHSLDNEELVFVPVKLSIKLILKR